MVKKLDKTLRRKTIAVFGASSNIGRRFVHEATKQDLNVIAIARKINKIFPTRKDYLESIEIIQADITKKDAVEKVFEGKNIDVSINFAVDFSTNYEKAKAVNVNGEQNIINASIQNKVRRHVYISSIATMMSNSTTYKITKLEAEARVKATDRKLEWIILRYGHVLGTPTWDQPFKVKIPYLRLGIPQVPTDAKNAFFPYSTIDTVVEATLAAIDARPNQTITVFDGKITVGKYLATMEKIHNINMSFLPGKLLQILDILFGQYIPLIRRNSAAIQFLSHPPVFDNEKMKKELHIKPRDFQKWTRNHFSEK